MALPRLTEDKVYRLYLASPYAFADWTDPQSSELNANPTNNPNGLVFNVTCAVNVEGSQFDLDDFEADTSLTFCQKAGDSSRISDNATVVYNIVRSKEKWDDASSVLAADGFNVSELARTLISWRGVEYFAILSIGEADDEPFAADQEVSMIRVATDWATDEIDTGSYVNMNQAFAFRGDILWNHPLSA